VERLGANICFVAIGLISTCILTLGGPGAGGLAGTTYMLIAPVLTIYFSVMGRCFSKLGFDRH
jgi:hypothetical protein